MRELANICLGPDERKKTKRFFDNCGYRVVSFQKRLRRENFEWKEFSDLENFNLFAEHVGKVFLSKEFCKTYTV